MKEVRPTTGKTLSALFSILTSAYGTLDGRTFLDLFSGTGRVAKTARDCGAEIVTVELLRDRAAEIRRSLGEEKHTQLCMDVRRALKWLRKRGMTFDIIFADPPYDMEWGAELPRIIAAGDVLKSGGTVIIEHSESEKLDLAGTPYELIDSRKYGKSVLGFLRACGARDEASDARGTPPA